MSLTPCLAAVAETGTLMLVSGADTPTTLNFLPDTHIVVVRAGQIVAGYEDAWYFLWREGRLPVNVDPLDARLEDEQERDRLRRVFQRGLDAPVGFALPISRDVSGTRWRT